VNRPLVSVCLPNRNSRPYLPERIDTIFGQTYQNWELIVSDNFSEDGAWEFFQSVAAQDSRVLIAQVRLGMYEGWNDCIRRARGKYVYIATSDDTMAPDCLEKLVAALEQHPECDIAHCNLRVIDSSSREFDHGWSTISLFALSSGALIDVPHVRVAPFDALLVFSGRTVYWSVTQLLIRRDLFERTGLFESRWGSIGDANWQMRACLVANTVHVASTWAGWRVHPDQATGSINYYSSEHERKTQEMIDHAIRSMRPLIPKKTFARLQKKWSCEARSLRRFLRGIEQSPSKRARRLFFVRELLKGEFGASLHLRLRTQSNPYWPEAARKWAFESGVKTSLIPLDRSSQP
jgi:glycosyltransferase involved in cell wall biosynthesis